MTLPLGTKVVVTIVGPALIAAANVMHTQAKTAGWTYEDCLAMCSISSINGEPVAEVTQDSIPSTKEFITLVRIVSSLVAPSDDQIQQAARSVTLMEPTPGPEYAVIEQ